MAGSYYTILGVPQNATSEQVRTKFLDLAKKMHPDRFQGDEKTRAEETFQQITEAFNVLRDASRRREHDEDLARPEQEQQVSELEQLFKIHMQRGVKDFREKNYSAAADNFNRATRADPTNAKAWYHVALACSNEQRWKMEAVSAIDRACKLEPMNGKYAKLAGRLNERAGKLEEAERFYAAALEWAGPDPEIEEALSQIRKGRKGRGRLFGRSS